MSQPRHLDEGPLAEPVDVGTPAPCRAACPVGTDAAAYCALIAEGRIEEAYDVARGPNPLTSICGRICSAPCESACRRGVVDAPLTIRALKRVLTEKHGVEVEHGSRWRRAVGELAPAEGASVAIVGAGPAGLSAAHDLRIAGYCVTLLERHERAGGMLVQGVPAFRLPRALIGQEIQAILDLGVTLRSGCEVGKTVTIDELLEEHDMVLVTVGCGQGRLLETPGVELPGVLRAVDFLRRANAVSMGRFEPLQGPVVVIGGGSVAFDAARSAWRLQGEQGGHAQTMLDAARTVARDRRQADEAAGAGGEKASTVTLVAPEAREALAVPTEELGRAEEEGVVVRGQLGVMRVVGSDAVEGVEVAPVRRLYDDAGNFAPQLDPEHAEILPARSVVLAIGQRSDTEFLAPLGAVEASAWGGVKTDGWGRTTHPRIFAAGDVATGPRDLIDAVAAGQRAASAIVHALRGGAPDSAPPRRAITPPAVSIAPPRREPRRFWSGYDTTPRAELPHRPTDAVEPWEEIEAPLDPASARDEARRCLRCDEHLQLSTSRCIACGLCADICPYGCIALEPAAGGVVLTFDDSSCIRCDLCVVRCPDAALAFALAPARPELPLLDEHTLVRNKAPADEGSR
jgi:formate dehydrogenase (NADP+) beta subunit